MADVKYTDDHEYIRVDGDVVTVGITKYAQEQLGDVVFVELPDVGKSFAKGDEAAVVESVRPLPRFTRRFPARLLKPTQTLRVILDLSTKTRKGVPGSSRSS